MQAWLQNYSTLPIPYPEHLPYFLKIPTPGGFQKGEKKTEVESTLSTCAKINSGKECLTEYKSRLATSTRLSDTITLNYLANTSTSAVKISRNMVLCAYILVCLHIALSVSQVTADKTATLVLPPQCRLHPMPYQTYISRRGDLEQRCNDGLILQRTMMAHAKKDFRTTVSWCSFVIFVTYFYGLSFCLLLQTSPSFLITRNEQLQKTLIAVIRIMKELQATPVSGLLSSQIAGHVLNTSCNWVRFINLTSFSNIRFNSPFSKLQIRHVSQDATLTCSSEELENILVKIELYRVVDDLLTDAPGTITSPLEDLLGSSIGNSYSHHCDFWDNYILRNCTSSPSLYATAAHRYLVERHLSSQCNCFSSPLCRVSGIIDRIFAVRS